MAVEDKFWQSQQDAANRQREAARRQAEASARSTQRIVESSQKAAADKAEANPQRAEEFFRRQKADRIAAEKVALTQQKADTQPQQSAAVSAAPVKKKSGFGSFILVVAVIAYALYRIGQAKQDTDTSLTRQQSVSSAQTTNRPQPSPTTTDTPASPQQAPVAEPSAETKRILQPIPAPRLLLKVQSRWQLMWCRLLQFVVAKTLILSVRVLKGKGYEVSMATEEDSLIHVFVGPIDKDGAVLAQNALAKDGYASMVKNTPQNISYLKR